MLSPPEYIIPSIITGSTISRQGLLSRTERLILSIETVIISSRQSFLAHTDEIYTNIHSQEVEEYISECQTCSSPSPLLVPMYPQKVKAKKRKIRQCINRNSNKVQHSALAAHNDLFAADGFNNEDNLYEYSSNSSFSGMYSLYKEFNIVMFSITYCTKCEFHHIHRCHGYRLITGTNIFFNDMKEHCTLVPIQDI